YSVTSLSCPKDQSVSLCIHKDSVAKGAVLVENIDTGHEFLDGRLGRGRFVLSTKRRKRLVGGIASACGLVGVPVVVIFVSSSRLLFRSDRATTDSRYRSMRACTAVLFGLRGAIGSIGLLMTGRACDTVFLRRLRSTSGWLVGALNARILVSSSSSIRLLLDHNDDRITFACAAGAIVGRRC
ncbi:hypothetical protein PENTCL1PPCAC_7547, partial [Pristionchus entomophagus]